jgi:hypothetical protein
MPQTDLIKRAFDLLRQSALDPEPEPLGPKGPAFYCHGKGGAWIDVAAISLTPENMSAHRMTSRIKTRASDIGGQGIGRAYVSGLVSEADLQASFALAKRATAGLGSSKVDLVVISVPESPALSEWRTVQYSHGGRTYQIISFGAEIGGIPWPAMIPKPPPIVLGYVNSGKGKPYSQHVVNEFKAGESERFALVIEKSDQPFELRDVADLEGGEVPLRKSIRDHVTGSDKLLRAGMRTRPSPSMTAIFLSGPETVTEEALIPALYGDMTYWWGSDKADHETNGAFRPEQNTATSAVSLIQRNSRPITVHNAWAARPLPNGLLRGQDLRPGSNG